MPAADLPEPKQRILDAAQSVFAESGYRGGSLNEVAQRAGYTRAGLLHHFPSKEAMLLALLDRRDERLHTFELTGDRDLPTQLDGLPAVVGTILEDRVLIQLAHLLTAEASDPAHPARAWAAHRHRILRENTVAAVKRSVARGELPADVDATALAVVILGAVEGAENQWLVDPEVDPVAAARMLVRLVGALARA
jgi:AcrR family transcriptional regulator